MLSNLAPQAKKPNITFGFLVEYNLTKDKAYAKINTKKGHQKINNMENYLIERETLAEFVDSLIAKKTQPIENPDALREETIKKLDDHISQAIFGSLTKNQLDEINIILDQDETDDQAFQDFFNRAGVDLETIITKTMQDFGNEFLGGENA